MAEDINDETDFSEDFKSLDELSEAITMNDQTLAQETADHSNQELTVSPYPAALDVCPRRFTPPEYVACRGCPKSKWYGNNSFLRCWCKEMFKIVYENDSPDEAITYCDRNNEIV